MNFHVYNFEAETLCLGERMKGALHRPCCRTLRYSTITPALRYAWGREDIHAVGVIDKASDFRHLIYSPNDRVQSIAKIPLTVEYLSGVSGRIFVLGTGDPPKYPFELTLGGFRSKGFGRTKMMYVIPSKEQGDSFRITQGILGVRLPEHLSKLFGIEEVMRPVYGYLWEPDADEITRGKYVRSLFEGTLCRAPYCLLKEELTWTLNQCKEITQKAHIMIP